MLPDVDEILARRKKLGISQDRLARLTGISRPSISKMENGKADPRYSRVKAVFDILEKLERQGSSEAGFGGFELMKIPVARIRGSKYDVILDEFLESGSFCSELEVEGMDRRRLCQRLKERINLRNLKLITYVKKGIVYVERSEK